MMPQRRAAANSTLWMPGYTQTGLTATTSFSYWTITFLWMTSWIHSVIIESWTQTANTARHSERRNGVKISAAGQEACTPDRAAWPLPGLTARKPITQCHTRAHCVSSQLTTKSRHSCRSRSDAKHQESVKLTSWSNPPGSTVKRSGSHSITGKRIWTEGWSCKEDFISECFLMQDWETVMAELWWPLNRSH